MHVWHTCAVVPHGGLLEEAVDLQHLRVLRFGLQLLHLDGRRIKLSLKQQRGKYTNFIIALLFIEQSHLQCIQIHAMQEQVGIEHLTLGKGRLQVRLWGYYGVSLTQCVHDLFTH